MFELVNGKVVPQVSPNVGFINSIAALPSDKTYAISAVGKVILYQDEEQVAVLSVERVWTTFASTEWQTW